MTATKTEVTYRIEAEQVVFLLDGEPVVTHTLESVLYTGRGVIDAVSSRSLWQRHMGLLAIGIDQRDPAVEHAREIAVAILIARDELIDAGAEIDDTDSPF